MPDVTTANPIPSPLKSSSRLEEEGLFSRDDHGRLIRLERVKQKDYDEFVQLTVDGQPVKLRKAVPRLDSEGDIIRDAEGRPELRFSTIYDAAAELVRDVGQINPIPILCHREHLPPLGACRVCLVEAVNRGKAELVPACVQHVQNGMVVHTMNSQADSAAAERVRGAAQIIAELMLADHAPQTITETSIASNELLQVAKRLGVEQSRFSAGDKKRGQDQSSPMIDVNHDECIMCGRCQRGCNWVKENKIIGRSGKGYAARIAFDLDSQMGESNCVKCGECAISCPTGALTFKNDYLDRHRQKVAEVLAQPGEAVTTDELINNDWFRGIPYKFLQLNLSGITRRTLQSGEVLCREGEYGATAFLIERGSFEVKIESLTNVKLQTKAAGGIWGWLGRLSTSALASTSAYRPKLMDLGGQTLEGNAPIIRTVEDKILGEMSCLNRSRRSATIVAREECEVYEIRRNVLDMLLRNKASREVLDRVYRARIKTQFASLPIFSSLSAATRSQIADWMQQKYVDPKDGKERENAELLTADPSQPIFKEGDEADDFYIVSLGFVKVAQKIGETERVVKYVGPGNFFGEFALLSKFYGEYNKALGGLNSRRTATCSALDHVELFKITGARFKELLDAFPELKSALIAKAEQGLKDDAEAKKKVHTNLDKDFVDQGLYGAQNLLVIDLERCTRCDECTKACADTHEGITRLIRDGMRFDRFLVASSCRSCMDPYCMVGCPVDAIHRNGESLQIEIEDYCIGCGLCAENCPYGNINMHSLPRQIPGTRQSAEQLRATTCDMCMDVGGGPSCVRACPHDAAFRVDSDGLKKML